MTALKLVISRPVPRAHFVGLPLDQVAIVIAPDTDGVAVDQQIDRARGVQRSAGGVSKIDDPGNTLRVDVIQNRFEREIIGVHVGNRSELHKTRTASIPSARKRPVFAKHVARKIKRPGDQNTRRRLV